MSWLTKHIIATPTSPPVMYGATIVALSQNNMSVSLSTDNGATWTDYATPVKLGAGKIIWNGSKLVGVGQSNRAIWSTNGTSWNNITLPADSAGTFHRGLAWNGSVFCTVPYYSGDKTVSLTSTDGETWAAHVGALPDDSRFYDLVCNGTGDFCAVDASNGKVFTSPDGENWTLQTTLPTTSGGSPITWQPLAWNGVRYGALGWGKAYSSYSTDGIAWTSTADKPAVGETGWVWSMAKDGIFYAASEVGEIAHSTDMVDWTFVTTTGHSWSSMTWNESVFCAGSYYSDGSGASSKATATSTDGTNWTTITAATSPRPAGGVASLCSMLLPH